MKIKSVILILYLSLISNCAGVKEAHCSDVELRMIEINSWLNLMPGGPGFFHLSGEFSLLYKNDDTNSGIDIEKISVYTKDQLIYTYKPKLLYSRTEPDILIENKEVKVYQFYTERGLEIREPMMAAEYIDIELHFKIDDKSILETINKVELTRAY